MLKSDKAIIKNLNHLKCALNLRRLDEFLFLYKSSIKVYSAHSALVFVFKMWIESD